MQQGTGLVNWEIIYAKQAQKDAKKLAAVGLKDKALLLLEILKSDPYQNPRPYECGRRFGRCLFAANQYSAPLGLSGFG